MPDEIPEWSIITVAYNSREVLDEYWCTPPNGVEWIVIDNASTDGSAGVAARLGAQVTRLCRNVGFARGNNLGLRWARGPYILFANPDVRVSYRELPILKESVDRTGGFVSPQLLNADGTAQRNGRGLPYVRQKLAHRGVRYGAPRLDEYVIPTEESDHPVPVAWTMGAAIAGRADDFVRLGGWDERFFIYYEDHEFGLHAWERDYTVLVDPSIRWTHGWARATARMSFRPWAHELASAFRFYRKRPDLIARAFNPLYRSRKKISVPGIGEFVRRVE